jgi:hypothetical protein
VQAAQCLAAPAAAWCGSCSCCRPEGWRSGLAPGDVTVTRQVLSYFVRNPQAVDSLEGVARWRLLDEAIHVHVAAAREALDWLVARGVIQRTEGPGLPPVFSLDPERQDEAEQLLAELTSKRRTPRKER